MSGEKQGDREAMDRVTKRIMTDIPDAKKAREMARESMIRSDRELREQGKR